MEFKVVEFKTRFLSYNSLRCCRSRNFDCWRSAGLNQVAGLPLSTALLIGASLSATDPVSVTALFRELGVDKRLTTLMEGESLFNDGMAVVAFGFLVALPLGTAKTRSTIRHPRIN